jgi:hypothetical protein
MSLQRSLVCAGEDNRTLIVYTYVGLCQRLRHSGPFGGSPERNARSITCSGGAP